MGRRAARHPVQRSRRAAAPRREDAAPAATHYGRLAAIAVSAALIIVLVVAYFNPPPEPLPELADAEQEVVWREASIAASPPATVQLPDTPAEVTTEGLREEVMRLASDIAARFPHVPQALHAVALLYADLHQTAQAQQLWQQCIAAAPAESGPYIGLANAAMELGQDQVAVDTVAQARAAGCFDPELYAPWAAALAKLGRLDEAERVLQEGLEANQHADELWLQLGRVQLQLAKLSDAEASLLRALNEGTTDNTVYFLLATVCARQGKREEAAGYQRQFAETKAERASGEGPGFQSRYDAELRRIAVAALCRTAAVLGRHDQEAEAERALLRALELIPNHLTACNELVLLYRHMGRLADAQRVQQRLAAGDPQHLPHHLNLASLSSQIGDFDTAEAALTEVLRRRPDLAIGYLRLAQLHLQRGQPEQARWFAESALRQGAGDPAEEAQAHLVLAAACEQLGDQQAAQSAWSRAQQLAEAAAAAPRHPPGNGK